MRRRIYQELRNIPPLLNQGTAEELSRQSRIDRSQHHLLLATTMTRAVPVREERELKTSRTIPVLATRRLSPLRFVQCRFVSSYSSVSFGYNSVREVQQASYNTFGLTIHRLAANIQQNNDYFPLIYVRTPLHTKKQQQKQKCGGASGWAVRSNEKTRNFKISFYRPKIDNNETQPPLLPPLVGK